MKFIIVFFSLILQINQSHADISPIVKCLAKEEQKYHDLKIMGPLYKLNQEVINLLAIENKLVFNADFQKKVCESSNQALTFLRHLLLDSGEIFVIPKISGNDWVLTSYTSQVELFISKNYQIFLNLISYVQIEIKSPYCLKKLIPGYEAYLEREKYLKDIKAQHTERESLVVIKKILNEVSNLTRLKYKCDALNS